MRVHMVYQPFPEAPDFMNGLLDPDIELSWGDLDGAPENVEVLVAGRPSIPQLKHLQMVSTLVIPFAGVPAETRELLLEHYPDLLVYNLHHNAQATAEMAMGLLLAVAKNLIPADRAFRDHDWRIRYEPNQNIILKDSSVLILGFGAVGKSIARICRAFGMQVRAINRLGVPIPDDPAIKLSSLETLDELLPLADILFIALPLTPKTEGLIDQERLALLPGHAILVNVARAAVVDEEALYEALRTGSIAGAGIDVWYRYPEDEESRAHTPPASLPFHQLENVVMSPHRGGGSRKNEGLRLTHLADLLNKILRGEDTQSRVDLQEGY